MTENETEAYQRHKGQSFFHRLSLDYWKVKRKRTDVHAEYSLDEKKFKPDVKSVIAQSMEVREKGVKCREELTLLGVRFHPINFGERASFDSRVASKFLKAWLTRGNKGSSWDSGRVPGRNAKVSE
ncbi:hypothetical protein R3P38DRAFT_2762204 [Favolaschia claudopus]|uniref:Uncharacterized protein n=1 Tax=Favolaschia claudopus TaxID=2862362 RepID=A0AAW0DFK9_9AGAR